MPPKLMADAAKRAQRAFDAAKLKKATSLKVDIESVAVKKTVNKGLGTNTYNSLFGGGTERRMQKFHTKQRWLTEYGENFGNVPMEDPVSPVSGIVTTPTAKNNLREGIDAALKEQKLEMFAKKLSHTDYSSKELKEIFATYSLLTNGPINPTRTPSNDFPWDYKDINNSKYLLKKSSFSEDTNLELLFREHGSSTKMILQNQELLGLYSSYLAQQALGHDCDPAILSRLTTSIRCINKDGIIGHPSLLTSIQLVTGEALIPVDVGAEQAASIKQLAADASLVDKTVSLGYRGVQAVRDPDNLGVIVGIGSAVGSAIGTLCGAK